MQRFLYWGDGEEFPPLAGSLFIPVHQEKCPPALSPLHRIFIPPPPLPPKKKDNFHVITQ